MRTWLTLFGPTTPGEDGPSVAAGVRGAGANSLLLFTSLYMGYRLLQRRYPQRAIYSLEADRIFWNHDPDFYRESSIQPQRSEELSGRDLVLDLSLACAAEGLMFSALVPICAGQRLVQDRPDLAVTNLYGSKDRLFMCHNNPDLQTYRAAMIHDLCRYEIGGLMLDKIPQTMLEPRGLSGFFDPLLRTSGSLCFCSHCYREARKYDLDLNEVRAKAHEIADRSLRVPAHVMEALSGNLVGDTEIPLLLLEEPLVRRMLEFRYQSAVAVTMRLQRLAKSLRPNLVFQLAFVPPTYAGHDVTSSRAWLAIQSYKLYADAADEIHCVVHQGPDVIRFEMQRAVDAAAGKIGIVAAMRLYGATRPDEVSQMAEAALAAGVQDLHFLGYDIASQELLDALAAYSKSQP